MLATTDAPESKDFYSATYFLQTAFIDSKMSQNFIFPKPKDADTFEDIVRDVFARAYKNNNLQRYGRSGQKQHGVDIAGLSESKLIGIQSKNHPSGRISKAEIAEEITRSENFKPGLDEYVIATSADRDVDIHSFVLEISQSRTAQHKYPVAIKFWDDIYDMLCDYPDLVYKHFTKYFPLSDLENISYDLSKLAKKTLHWPVSEEELIALANENVGGIPIQDPYNLSIGLTTFKDVSFAKMVDLELQFSDYMVNNTDPLESSQAIAASLSQLRATLANPFFSKEIFVYLQSRLTVGYLLGWTFRKVTKYELKLYFGGQLWATNGLPWVSARLYDDLPELLEQDSDEVVVILNIRRNIRESVYEYVKSMAKQPKAVLSYSLQGYTVDSAAHALSLSIEISNKIRNLVDVWRVKKIHLFGALPAALATMIGYHVNAICPIAIYFLDETRSHYLLGAEIKNS